MELGKKISRLRGNLPYAEIGRVGDCSAPTIRDIESGFRKDTSVRLVARLARYFNVPLDWLADDSQDWPPPEDDRRKASEMIERVLSGAGLAGDLSNDEREILANWRRLDHPLRQKVIGYVIGLATTGNQAGADLGASLAENLARSEPAADRNNNSGHGKQHKIRNKT